MAGSDAARPGQAHGVRPYAEWCGPCRLVDARLREILGQRTDVAVRRLNVVSFNTPLAGDAPNFQALPYLIVSRRRASAPT